jgi:hypothetical protein
MYDEEWSFDKARIDGFDLHLAKRSNSWFFAVSLGGETVFDEQGRDITEELEDDPG